MQERKINRKRRKNVNRKTENVKNRKGNTNQAEKNRREKRIDYKRNKEKANKQRKVEESGGRGDEQSLGLQTPLTPPPLLPLPITTPHPPSAKEPLGTTITE